MDPGMNAILAMEPCRFAAQASHGGLATIAGFSTERGLVG
jgi:hypothetical protein